MDTTVTLPGGLWLAGQQYQQVGLRPLTGVDEAYLQEYGSALLPAETTTAVLSRSITHLDGQTLPCAPADIARALTIGSREALLLHLRRLTLGEQMPCVLDCPACSAPMDLDLRVADLLLPPYGPLPQEHTAEIGQNGSTQTITFRLPTGADQEIAARLARQNPAEAAAALLQPLPGFAPRCTPHHQKLPPLWRSTSPKKTPRLKFGLTWPARNVTIALSPFLTRPPISSRNWPTALPIFTVRFTCWPFTTTGAKRKS